MLIVTIELFSAATQSRKVIGRTLISNTGEGTKDRANYSVKVGNRRNALNPRKIYDEPAREGFVENYPRTNLNVWRLVMRALNSAFPEEAKRKGAENGE